MSRRRIIEDPHCGVRFYADEPDAERCSFEPCGLEPPNHIANCPNDERVAEPSKRED